jgi:TM2 domain-containing membrane protein YozV
MDKCQTEFDRIVTTFEVYKMTHAGTAAVLSLVVPGVGQIYNGDFLRGIFWLIITPGFWIGTGGLLGWVCHVIASYTAYNRGLAYQRAQ